MFYNVFVAIQTLWRLSASGYSNTTKKKTARLMSRSELHMIADRLTSTLRICNRKKTFKELPGQRHYNSERPLQHHGGLPRSGIQAWQQGQLYGCGRYQELFGKTF